MTKFKELPKDKCPLCDEESLQTFYCACCVAINVHCNECGHTWAKPSARAKALASYSHEVQA